MCYGSILFWSNLADQVIVSYTTVKYLQQVSSLSEF